jgi:DNA modification methylase
LFLLSKSERYFYDAEAIRERGSDFLNGRESRHYTNPKQSNGDFGVKPGNISGSEVREFRNKRSVWTVPTTPYSEAHFATYPPDLIKPCILAGSRPHDTILDPFAGSGTTGAVAIELARKAILIELNPVYIPLIEQRCSITPGFAL